MISGLEIWVYNVEEDIGMQISTLGWTVKEKSQTKCQYHVITIALNLGKEGIIGAWGKPNGFRGGNCSFHKIICHDCCFSTSD